MSKCLIAEYETSAHAKASLEQLEKDQFTLDQVSVVSSASDPTVKYLEGLHDEENSNESAPDDRSTSIGMLIGGTVAAPIAAGTLVGPFIIAGPLVGMAIGAAVGSILSSMERWGVAHDVSGDYEKRVESGSVLIIVHHVDDSRINDAEAILKTTDAKTIERYEA